MHIICCRRRQVEGVPAPGAMEGARAAAPAEVPPNPEAPLAQLRWQNLVAKIQARKQWSDRGRMLNYAKHGVPRNLDGKPTGFGKHLGRWAWREIRPSW